MMRSMKFPRVVLFALICLLPPAISKAQEAEGARKVLLKTQAIYPTLAQSMNLHGVVKLEAHVAANGSVKSVAVKGGHPILTQSAVTAVGHWKFEPASHETVEQVEVKFDVQ
jgi:TonB family protein